MVGRSRELPVALLTVEEDEMKNVYEGLCEYYNVDADVTFTEDDKDEYIAFLQGRCSVLEEELSLESEARVELRTMFLDDLGLTHDDRITPVDLHSGDVELIKSIIAEVDDVETKDLYSREG